MVVIKYYLELAGLLTHLYITQQAQYLSTCDKDQLF